MSRRLTKNRRRAGVAAIAAAMFLTPQITSAQAPGRNPHRPGAVPPTFDRLMEARAIVAGTPVAMEKAAYLGLATSLAPPVLRKHLKLPDGVGLAVDYVEPDSPAAAAGLETYDVAVRLNDQMLVNPQQLAVLVRTFDPGTEVTLTVIREMKETPVKVTLIEREVKPLNEVGFGMMMMDEAMGVGGMARAQSGMNEDVMVAAKPGKLNPGDLLEIAIDDLQGPGQQTLERKRIDKQGNITLPLLKKSLKASTETEASLPQIVSKAYVEAGMKDVILVSVKRVSPAPVVGRPDASQVPIRQDDRVMITLHDVEGPGTATAKQARLGPDGTLSLPNLTEPVKAVGVTPGELEKTILELYSKAGFTGKGSVSVSVSANAASKPSAPDF